MPSANHHAKLRNPAGILALAVVICGGGLLGCTQDVSLGQDCAAFTITSDDANITFTYVNGHQCDIPITARDAGQSLP